MVLGNWLKVLAAVGQEQGSCEPAVQGAEVLGFAFFFFSGAGNEISALVQGRKAPYHRALHSKLRLQVLTGRKLTFRTVRSPS